MRSKERKLAMLVQANGKFLVEEWTRGLRDKTTRLKIERQIGKLSRGLGVQKSIGTISELQIDLGPGYRVYFGLLDPQTLIVLIGGGDKSNQRQDITQAKQPWKEFEESGYTETALRFWKEELEIDTEGETE